MAKARWIAPWSESQVKPAVYHLISRVVERRHAFGAMEKEKFRILMRMAEGFTGCRVLSYCMMSNHFHMLLEVPPKGKLVLTDAELLRRVGLLYPKWKVAELRERLAAAEASPALHAELVNAYSYRMHDLSEFMKLLLQRFSTWFNRRNGRTGRLWEQRFKSVLVENGTAARTMAAYIDLNPVRAGICGDPAEYRWSSYGEAVAGGAKARAGLVRAWRGHEGVSGTARGWMQGGLSRQYREILLGRAGARGRECDLRIAQVIRHRVRHFTDGAVIGGRAFVDEVFAECREYFGPRRKTGARKPRGALAALAGELWSARDLRVETG